ncbi:MAG: metal-dependent hydrolase [Bacteroidetes bacterium]|nr:metal-dependent hydrolase [Bacteroidota bacterium]
MKLTYYGHACFLLETGGKKILFDPFIKPNPLASHIDVDAIEADYILITHGHEDHVADALEIAKRTGATVVSNYKIVMWYAAKGVENGHPLNHGGQKKFDFGTVKYVNAIHTSSMPDGSYGGQPGGFVVTTEEGCLYHAGDTALTYDMKLLGHHMNIDLALLPIGDNFTMGVDDAIIASGFINCRNVVGMHYDSFDLIKIDRSATERKFKAAGLELKLMDIGSSIEF